MLIFRHRASPYGTDLNTGVRANLAPPEDLAQLLPLLEVDTSLRRILR